MDVLYACSYVCYCLCSDLYDKDAPVIIPEVIDQTLNEGDMAFFTFQATGTPIPNISWYFNGAPVEKTNVNKYMISELSFNPTTKNSTLKIMNVELFDIGTYTCDAANTLSSEISSGVLTVNGKYCMLTKYCMCVNISIGYALIM